MYKLFKQLLSTRETNLQDTGIAWVRSHIGIPGNEAAAKLAAWSSHLGQTTSATRTVTEGGLRAAGKAERAIARRRPGYHLGTATTWSRPALSAYLDENGERPTKARATLRRQGREPPLPMQPTHPQTGLHITFTCPLHTQTREQTARR